MRHAETATHAHSRRGPTAYTLGHAGRQVRIGPVVFWTIVGVLVIMGVWSAATATYFLFQDDLLTRLIARQADMQYAYEDRVAELRAQVDRLASRQLLDQDQFEQKLVDLARRQSTLESRATTLSTLADPSATGSIKSAPRGEGVTLKPSPMSEPITLRTSPERGAQLDAPAARSSAGKSGLDLTLARLKESLDRVEARQNATLVTLEQGLEAKAKRMRGVLAELGLDSTKIVPVSSKPAVGGPFVPLPASAGGIFERGFQRVSLARGRLDQLDRVFVGVPIRKPVNGELDQSSGFGVRLDPFIRAYAMHTGLDFRGNPGDPIRATAGGTVVAASWSGGYGRMVEIDHGNGLSTRYGHLSAIEVHEGQIIRPGQVIGRLGSTGRSTGPHLHYETRIDGEAVDPQKFLRAGARLGAPS
jgi:murein DD-endopeptidase MepM/ murein hydrolase activator NlpD